MRSNGRCLVGAIVCLLLLLTGCRHEEEETVVYQSRYHWVDKTIAVVAPIGDEGTAERLNRTADWFCENFFEAQLQDTLFIRLNIEWYDELSEDLQVLGRELANRDDIAAVIGPFANDHVATFASACQRTQKAMIAPTATSEDVIRRFAVGTAGVRNKKPFLWSLTETDITMSEVMMSMFATYNQISKNQQNCSAALFTPNDVYGRTFADWAPYQAENMGFNLLENEQYSNSNDLQQRMKKFFEQRDYTELNRTATFCVLEDSRQFYDIARMRRQWAIENVYTKEAPSSDVDDPLNDVLWAQFEEMFRSWIVFNAISEEGITALGERGMAMIQGYQGFSPYADPTTGFELSYKKRFGVCPTFAECKFYDALMLAAFAAFYVAHQGDETNEAFNNAIIAITNDVNAETTMGGSAWNITAMEVYLKAMEHGRLLKLRGASGNIRFDKDTYTAATHTTYVHWRILDGKIVHQNYFSSSGSQRVSQSTAAWRWMYDEMAAMADFDEQAGDPTAPIAYLPLTDQYAVLVQGSSGFKNYRHQADVLNMYQLLRRQGFDDDHIVLVLDKNLATDSCNNEPGTIRSIVGGPDLLGGTTAGYPAAVVDYDNATLTAADISNILTGIAAKGDSNEALNILFYWSGHGHNANDGGVDELQWLNTSAGNGFTALMMQQTATAMMQQHCRKLLVVTEPCYSEVVIRAVSGIRGVLGLSGASATEQSFADHWNNDLGENGAWMCDCFSTNLIDYLSANPTTTYRDLYLYCTQHTLGSHVKVVNAPNFGNLYMTSPQEFFTYLK